MLYERAELFSRVIMEEAQSRDIPVADIWSVMRDRPEILGADALHPNDAGHALLADTFWPAIERALGQPHGDIRYSCDYNRVLRERDVR